MKYIAFCAVGIVICIAIIIIIRIRNKPIPFDIQNQEQDKDFIETFSNRKRRKLAGKPWAMNYKTYKIIATVSSVILGVFAFVCFSNFIYTVVFAAAGFLIPELIIYFQSASQKAEFEERYATSLRQLVACLKSGLSIQQAVSDVCVSPFVHDIVKQEYKQIDSDIKLGITVKEAFERFADRVKSQDARDVAIAITMQAKVGGRDAETIESIAKNISSRIMLRKEITSMFAGSNMTVIAMDFVPFAVVAMMYFFAPTYLAPFFESPTLTMVFFGLIAVMGIGSIATHASVKKMKKECGV